MRNCNSRTKLKKKNYKKNKNEIRSKKKIRTEIEKPKPKPKRTIIHFIWQEREKKGKKRNDHQQQSDYHTPSCVTPCARGHGGTSKRQQKG
jgi:hypothetical protein